MVASTNPNTGSNALPGCGTSYSIHSREIFSDLDSTNIAANAINSGAIAQNLIQTATVTIPNASVVTAYDLGIQVLAAPGVGKSIFLLDAVLRYTYGVHAFTAGGVIQLQYDSTTHAGGTAPLTTLAASVLTTASSSDNQMQQAASVAVPQNKGIFFANATQDFALAGGSTSSVQIIVHYYIA